MKVCLINVLVFISHLYLFVSLEMYQDLWDLSFDCTQCCFSKWRRSNRASKWDKQWHGYCYNSSLSINSHCRNSKLLARPPLPEFLACLCGICIRIIVALSFQCAILVNFRRRGLREKEKEIIIEKNRINLEVLAEIVVWWVRKTSELHVVLQVVIIFSFNTHRSCWSIYLQWKISRRCPMVGWFIALY